MHPDSQSSPFGILGRALGTGPLGGLKRHLRWFNLTMLQQALWPLLIAVASAPQVDFADTPAGWYALRISGPALAVLVALLYIHQQGRSGASVTSSPFLPATDAAAVSTHPIEPTVTSSAPMVIPSQPAVIPGPSPVIEGAVEESPAPECSRATRSVSDGSLNALPSTISGVVFRLRPIISPPQDMKAPAIATQVRYALLALPVVIAVLRIVGGPPDDAAKIVLFGLVNVAAFHLIHFGVVPLSYDDRRQGLITGGALFGISWGLHNALMFGLSDGNWLPGLAAGCVLGWLFGFGSLGLRHWPGGLLTGAAVQFLVVYLIAGFL